jgi:hypothetical protein
MNIDNVNQNETDIKDSTNLDETKSNEPVETIDEKNNNNVSHETQMNALKQNFKINYPFYLTIIICCYVFATKQTNSYFWLRFVKLIFTFFVSMIIGHTIHWVAHHINFENYLNSCDNILTRTPFVKNISSFICKLIDFHSITHHESKINKKHINIVGEILNNVITQSVFVVWFIQNLLDFRIVLLWSLYYATTHNINYSLLKPTTHRDHHLNHTTNYGLDVTDILFNTKYNWEDIENYNHSIINLIAITSLILYLKI